MYKRIFSGIGVAGILIVSASIAAQPTLALTAEEIQTQIRELQAKITELTKQLSALRGSSAISNPGSVSGNAALTAVFATSKHRVCGLIVRNLVRGSSGDDVKGLQEFLAERGHFSASATGYFGPITSAALARWQAAEGIDNVGALGPLTRERIKNWCGGGNTERFGAEPQRGKAPLTVVFKTNVTLTNPGMIADAGDYKIVFGDGSEYKFICTSTTGSCPGPHRAEHTYSSDGTYTATLVHYGYFGPPGPNGLPEQIVGKTSIYVGDKIACTKEYRPVCGSKQVVCITTPCNPVQQTYGNRCMMEADGASFLYEGACRSDTGNKPPVISSFSGPTTLAVNTSGTWTISASDPENQTLSYYVTWGDEYSYQYQYANMMGVALDAFVQTTTFTHAYAFAGTYTVSIVVHDTSGKEAKTSTTVKIGDSLVACTLQYDPVCGQPPEPACRHSIPACMMATPGPQTYGNRCMMNAAGAAFLYSGQCQNTYTACTADAKQCPDGSYVGRTGPNCQFVCPAH